MQTNSSDKLNLAAGKILFREGQSIDKIYVIESGQVEMYRSNGVELSDDDLGIPYMSLKAGDVMGEVILFGATQFLSTAKTKDAVVLRTLSIEAATAAYAQIPKPIQKLIQSTLSKAQGIINSNQMMLSSVDKIQDSYGFLLGAFYSGFSTVARDKDGKIDKSDLQRNLFRIFGVRSDVFLKCLDVFEKIQVIEWVNQDSLYVKDLKTVHDAIQIYTKVTHNPEKENFLLADKSIPAQLEIILLEGKELASTVISKGLQSASFQRVIENANRKQIKLNEGTISQLKRYDLHLELKSTDQGVQLQFFPDELNRLSAFLQFHKELSTSFS